MIRSALVIVLTLMAFAAFGCSDSSSSKRSLLERPPNTLPRPPSDGRLPDDLRPPR